MTCPPVALWRRRMTLVSHVCQFQKEGLTWISGKVTVLNINATDAKTRTINMGKGLTIAEVTLPETDIGVTVSLPAKPTTVGHWTAGTKGTMTFSNGTFSYTVSDNLRVSMSLSCSAHPAKTLASTTVS
jgi:hypothetical protein